MYADMCTPRGGSFKIKVGDIQKLCIHGGREVSSENDGRPRRSEAGILSSDIRPHGGRDCRLSSSIGAAWVISPVNCAGSTKFGNSSYSEDVRSERWVCTSETSLPSTPNSNLSLTLYTAAFKVVCRVYKPTYSNTRRAMSKKIITRLMVINSYINLLR